MRCDGENGNGGEPPNAPVTIYVQLLDEDVPVWRPVAAEPVEGDLYRIIGHPPDGEHWPFVAGEVVRCVWRSLSGDHGRREDVLIAER